MASKARKHRCWEIQEGGSSRVFKYVAAEVHGFSVETCASDRPHPTVSGGTGKVSVESGEVKLHLQNLVFMLL